MRKKKLLLVTAAGMVMTIMLSMPVMADDSVSASTPANDNSQPQQTTEYSGNVPQDGGRVQNTQSNLPYPTDIETIWQGTRNYLHKTYTVASSYDPNQLVEQPFTQGDYRYKFSEIIHKSHTPGSAAKTVTDQRTVESSTGEQAEILALLGVKIPYSDNEGYIGELYLAPESLTISESGRSDYSYTITDTREYPNLNRNDSSYVPKTVQKNGATLNLQSIDWRVTGSENYGYSEVANSYTAVAYYSAAATGSKVSGYTATATYSGEVKKESIGQNVYTIVYEGEQIVIPFNFMPLIIAGVIVAGCVVACIILWRRRKNVTIYTMRQGVPELYGKVRVSPKNPVLDLSRLPDVDVRLVFDKQFDKALFDKKVFIIGSVANYQINMTGSLVKEIRSQSPYTDKPGENWTSRVSGDVE